MTGISQSRVYPGGIAPCRWTYGRGPVRGGMHVPRLNFKSCHFAISEGPYVAVGISSTAAPKF